MRMIPYLHLGPLQLPTFGLMVALALITAAYVLQADFDRRGMNADAFTMITVAGLVGIFGAKFYHLVDSEHLLDPEYRHLFFARLLPLLLSRYGFAWFGGFVGGFGALLVMRWRAKLPLWEFLDACSPAAACGYGIGRRRARIQKLPQRQFRSPPHYQQGAKPAHKSAKPGESVAT